MELLINPLSQRARELALLPGAAPNLFMREAAGHRTTTQNSLALLKRVSRSTGRVQHRNCVNVRFYDMKAISAKVQF